MGRAAIAWMAAILACPSAATAQSWPERPITLVVTFAAGGPADGTARLIAGELSDRLGQRVVVENKGGAGGNIGAAGVAKAPPDGYTLLLVTSGPGALNKLIYRSLPFDPIKDFAPVALVANIPQIVLVNPKLPVANLRDMVDYGKKRGSPLNIGNPGYGTGGHISAVLFARETGIDVTHIAYRGVAPLMTDVLAGQIDLGFAGYVPQIQNMKALAVTAAHRINVLPNVPTARETGVADLVAGVWYGLLAPAGTPREITGRINAIVNDFMASPRGRELADSLGMIALPGSPEDMAAFVAQELTRWAPVIRDAKIVMD